MSKRFLCGILIILVSVFSGTGSSSAKVVNDWLSISGYGNAHYMGMNGMPRTEQNEGHPSTTTLDLREFSLFVDAGVTDGVTVSTEIQAIANGHEYAANYGYVEVDVGSIAENWDSDLLGNLSFRGGRFLVPFLAYNENKASFRQYLMSNPFTAQNVVPVFTAMRGHEHSSIGWSDTGAMLNWNRELGELMIIDLKASLINGLGSDSEVLDDHTVTLEEGMMTGVVRPRNGLLGSREETDGQDNNHDKATTVKLTFKLADLPLDFGFSWYRGAWDNRSKNDLNMYGAHLNLLFDRWTLRGEYVLAVVEQEEGFDPVADEGETGPAFVNTTTGRYHMESWYVEGSVVPLRYGPDEDRYVRLITRYDYVDTNNKAEFSPYHRWRITPGMEWQFVTNTRLRYEFQYQELLDYDEAPDLYKEAGGKRRLAMHMISIIFSF